MKHKSLGPWPTSFRRAVAAGMLNAESTGALPRARKPRRWRIMHRLAEPLPQIIAGGALLLAILASLL